MNEIEIQEVYEFFRNLKDGAVLGPWFKQNYIIRSMRDACVLHEQNTPLDSNIILYKLLIESNDYFELLRTQYDRPIYIYIYIYIYICI